VSAIGTVYCHCYLHAEYILVPDQYVNCSIAFVVFHYKLYAHVSAIYQQSCLHTVLNNNMLLCLVFIRPPGTSRNFTGDVDRCRGDQVYTNFTRGAPYKIWEGKNVQNSARFLTTFGFDREYLRNASTCRKSE